MRLQNSLTPFTNSSSYMKGSTMSDLWTVSALQGRLRLRSLITPQAGKGWVNAMGMKRRYIPKIQLSPPTTTYAPFHPGLLTPDFVHQNITAQKNHRDPCFALTAWCPVGSPGVLPQSDTEAYRCEPH